MKTRKAYGLTAFLWLPIFGQLFLFSYDWRISYDFIGRYLWHPLISIEKLKLLPVFYTTSHVINFSNVNRVENIEFRKLSSKIKQLPTVQLYKLDLKKEKAITSYYFIWLLYLWQYSCPTAIWLGTKDTASELFGIDPDPRIRILLSLEEEFLQTAQILKQYSDPDTYEIPNPAKTFGSDRRIRIPNNCGKPGTFS